MNKRPLPDLGERRAAKSARRLLAQEPERGDHLRRRRRSRQRRRIVALGELNPPFVDGKWQMHVSGTGETERLLQQDLALCRERHLPSATVRAISDAANEDLPLDFNALMTPGQKLSFVRLARTLVAAPGKIPALRRLQRQTTLAAKNLARVLAQVMAG